MEEPQPRPIEVVHVIPNDFTVNQVVSVFVTLGINTFLTPLMLRALLRNFGIDMSYGKAIRTYYAIRVVAHGTLPGGYQYPAGKGKLWTERVRAYLNKPTPTQEALDRIRRRHEELNEERRRMEEGS